MKRAFLLAALLALVAGASAPAKLFHSQLGIVTAGGTARLVVLDPETLAPKEGLSVALGERGGAWAVADDGSQLVYADRSRLRFVNLFSPGEISDVPTFGTGPVAWVDRETVILLRRAGRDRLEIVKVDAFAHAILSRKQVAGTVLETRSVPGTFVALLGRENKIAPLRLLVVDAGPARVVRLDRMRGGTAWSRGTPPVGTTRRPALAIDERRANAYVVDPAGLLADVPLGSGNATYRALRGRFTKVLRGSLRRALVLGGLLAITGDEFPATGWRPAGLELVDTQAWTSRVVEPRARGVWEADGTLLVAGPEMGLTALDRTGQLRFRLFEGSSTWVNAVTGSRAYVGVAGQTGLAVVDVASGQVVGVRTEPLPTLIVGRSSSD